MTTPIVPARKIPFRAGYQAPTQLVTAEAVVSPATAAVPNGYLLADCSEWQPEIIDAAYLSWSKAIVIRCAYGDQHDDKAWYGGERRTDLHAGGAKFVGIYQYLVDGQDGAAQADVFHSLVGSLQPGEVAIADFEEGKKETLTAWYNRMIALGYEDKYLWTYSYLNFAKEWGIVPVDWMAFYDANDPVGTYTKLWQFSGHYNIPGVGYTDCSLFHGTIDQLAAMAYQEPAPKPKEWLYERPTNLQTRAGRTNVHATWDAPADQPLPDHYLVWVYKGGELVATYPRKEPSNSHQSATFPDPGHLHPNTAYTIRVAAFGPNGSHPGPLASVDFRTSHLI